MSGAQMQAARFSPRPATARFHRSSIVNRTLWFDSRRIMDIGAEHRKIQRKFCSATRRVRDRNVASERPHDATHNRQAEAGALLAAFAPPKPLEDLLPHMLRNARS